MFVDVNNSQHRRIASSSLLLLLLLLLLLSILIILLLFSLNTYSCHALLLFPIRTTTTRTKKASSSSLLFIIGPSGRSNTRATTPTTIPSLSFIKMSSLSSWLMTRQLQQQQKRSMMDDDNDHDDVTKAAPLYITIGPPCCGKTSWATRNKQQQRDQQQKQKIKKKLKMTSSSQHQQDQEEQDQKERNIDNQDVIDIAIDDQDGIYWKIPFDIFMKISLSNDFENDKVVNEYSEQFIYNKTIKERILSSDQKELCTVLHYLFNVDYDSNTLSEFSRALLQLQSQEKQSSGLTLQHQILYEVMKEYIIIDNYNCKIQKTLPSPPSTIDLFVREAIFTSPPRSSLSSNTTITTTMSSSTTNIKSTITESNTNTNTMIDMMASTIKTVDGSGIERAIDIMKNSPLHQSIVWSNTNTRASDYKMALQIAYEHKRPVHYIVYYDNDYDNTDNSVDNENDNMILKQIKEQQQNQDQDNTLFDLVIMRYDSKTKSLSNADLHNHHNECYKELLRRNIKRFIDTGRYIPCHVIYDMKIRSKQMIQNIIKQQYDNNRRINNNDNNNITKIQYDCMLTQLNRYDMNMNDRTVNPIIMNHNNNNQQRYQQNQQRQQPYQQQQRNDRSQQGQQQQQQQQRHHPQQHHDSQQQRSYQQQQQQYHKRNMISTNNNNNNNNNTNSNNNDRNTDYGQYNNNRNSHNSNNPNNHNRSNHNTSHDQQRQINRPSNNYNNYNNNRKRQYPSSSPNNDR